MPRYCVSLSLYGRWRPRAYIARELWWCYIDKNGPLFFFLVTVPRQLCFVWPIDLKRNRNKQPTRRPSSIGYFFPSVLRPVFGAPFFIFYFDIVDRSRNFSGRSYSFFSLFCLIFFVYFDLIVSWSSEIGGISENDNYRSMTTILTMSSLNSLWSSSRRNQMNDSFLYAPHFCFLQNLKSTSRKEKKTQTYK